MTTAFSQIGRVVTAAVMVTAGAALVLGWLRRNRPAPVPVVRCPIHGIAYDAELEMCPDCSKTHVITGTETRNLVAQPFETMGGAR